MIRKFVGITVIMLAGGPRLFAQYPAGQHHTPNVKIQSHVPLGPALTVMDLEIEQELARPYAYVSRSNYGRVTPPQIGFDIVSVKDINKAQVIQRWRIDRAELRRGLWRHGREVLQAQGPLLLRAGLPVQPERA